MFKSAKWRSDKIKVVFKMQFQATQVPQIKAKTLTLSVVPADVGKPTVRLEKAPIFEGNCYWEHPIYETVKLVREPKMERFKEKIFHFIVSTRSSKSGVLGENSIDLADLADATKPLTLSLPLQTSNTGAILHVTIQKMQGDLDSRCTEESEALVEDFDSYGKRNLQSPENGSFGDTESDNNGVYRRSYTDMSLESASDRSIVDKTNSFDETCSRDGVEETSNDIIGKLKNQTTALERRAEVSELEVQSLRKQAMKESKKAQELLKQIDCLKEERDAIISECEQIKSLRKVNNGDVVSSDIKKETEILRTSLEDIKQELRSEKQSNKKLKLQLQKTEDSNSELVLALRDLEKMMDQKNKEISRLSSKMKAGHSGEEALAIASKIKKDQDQEKKAKEDLVNKQRHADEAEMLKQEIKDLYCEIEICRKEKEEVQMQMEKLTMDYERLEKENEGIHNNLEQTQEGKMEIQQNYSESLVTIKQFKLQVENFKEEINRKGLRHSESLNRISELETQVIILRKELEKQAQDFENELGVLTQAKVEQEQRAIRAEEELRKTRWKNAATTERLQEEFRQLSVEMAFRIDENEQLANNAVAEANDLRQKNKVLEELLQKAEEEVQLSKDQYERKFQELLNENSLGAKEACTGESEMLQKLVSEKEDVERELASVRKEAEELSKESISMRSQIVQKKRIDENLHLELEKLKTQYNEMEHRSIQLELENESMKKEASKLQGALHKKEQESKPTEHMNPSALKERKNMGGYLGSAGMRTVEGLPTQNGFDTAQIISGEMQQRTMLKLNGDHAGDTCDVSSLLSVVESLKERNKSMEDELKEMQERYSEISLRFAEVEGERQELVMTVRCLKNGKKN
ncbi:Myosin heavy chain-related protein [Abeliophyllum distichum]|uniref:Myosin heavy chain-related protein n=1 Tax=Abeliophyllum distichum TaxID=126358 RepID=A0ABD1VZI7_9LAMI